MKRTFLLFILCQFSIYFSIAQTSNLRIVYNAAACSGSNPLAGAPAVYLYAGCATSSPSGAWEKITGNISGGGLGEMTNIGPDLWAICINPHGYFNVPANQTIYNITMFFRDYNGFAGGIYTGNCVTPVSSYAELDWVSNQWQQANGSYNVTPDTCSIPVGISFINAPNEKLVCTPNPMQLFTEFSFTNTISQTIQIDVFNILGKKVKSLVSENKSVGFQRIYWNGRSDNGDLLANGCYFYTLTSGQKTVQSGKLIISR